jgi:hypothetical protein
MRFCTSCGAVLDSDKDSCTQCGAAAPQITEPAMPAFTAASPDSAAPAALVKRHGSSQLFFVGIISLAASILLSLIITFTASDDFLTNLLDEIEEIVYADADFTPAEREQVEDLFEILREFAVDDGQTIMNLQSVVSLIPSILILVGLWLFYKSCGDPNNRTTTGLSLVKGVNIFLFILILIILIAITVIMVLSISFMTGEMGISDVGGVINGALIVVMVITLALFILYYISLFKIINGVRNLLQGNNAPAKFGMIVPVFLFIGAAVSSLSLLTVMEMLDLFTLLQSVLSTLPGLLMAIAYVKFRAEYLRTRIK